MNPSRSPGRPLSFDPHAALEQAVGLFWQRGYADASIHDLATAMGINRPSLYAVFGDKEALFLKAINAYRDGIIGRLDALFAQDQPLRASIHDLFEQAVSVYTVPRDAPRGCLLASAAPAEAAQSDAVRVAVRDALHAVESAIRRGVASRSSGDASQAEPASGQDAARIDAMALMASSSCYALAVRARLGVSARRLRAGIPTMVDSVLMAGRRPTGD